MHNLFNMCKWVKIELFIFPVCMRLETSQQKTNYSKYSIYWKKVLSYLKIYAGCSVKII